MRRTGQLLLIAVFLSFAPGCGVQPRPPQQVGDPLLEAAPASLTVTDTPPAGVTVLYFSLNLTGATLYYQGGGSASLLSSTTPIPVNVTQLQNASAFLDLANVEVYNGESSPASATFTSLSVTFANPQLTIYNGSGATIGTGANACPNDSICQLSPSASPLSLSFSGSPFPLAWSANESLSFLLDVHLDTVIQPDFSLNLAAPNGVTVSQLPAPSSGGTIAGLGVLTGTIQSLNPAVNSLNLNGFTLETATGRTFTIDVNGSTTFNNFPSSACSTGSYSCLATQQIVKVELSLPTGQTQMLATEVGYVQPASQTAVEGTIISVGNSDGNTLMNLILQQQPGSSGSVPLGQFAAVTVPPAGVTYAVDSGSFTIPSGLSFSNAASLFVGQEVSVTFDGTASPGSGSGSSIPWGGPGSISFTADSITLEPSHITGTVQSVDASALTFSLNTNANFFLPPATSGSGAPPTPAPFGITVQTTAATTFTNFTPDSINGVAANQLVSVEGWVFLAPDMNNLCAPNIGCGVYPVIAADSVLARTGTGGGF